MTHPILERLASSDPAERRAACLAAGRDPSATLLTEALSGALGDPVKAVGRAASDALVEIAQAGPAQGPAPATGPGKVDGAVRIALHSDDPARRWRAAFTAARLEPPTPRLLPALVEGLASGDGDVRWASAKVIVEIGRLHPEVLAILVGLVRSGESPVVRRMATFALRELAPDCSEAADVLLEAADDDDLQVRRAALTAMASLQGPPTQVGQRLLATLQGDVDGPARRLAALALGEIGAQDPDRVPAETQTELERSFAAAGEDPDLRRAIEKALARLQAGRPGA